ncbi:hypothetical protein C8R42DRAFT_672415 [Lentinula raphanica]|nr:hypothetical protein C8R42DRAFT_681262 [Lentinula raphanica]KAJ3720020.1 hypothetical protein C8R42DRAFT_672415 [Lentinula raphanica]
MTSSARAKFPSLVFLFHLSHLFSLFKPLSQMISALRDYFLALANFAACTSSLATCFVACNFSRFKA